MDDGKASASADLQIIGNPSTQSSITEDEAEQLSAAILRFLDDMDRVLYDMALTESLIRVLRNPMLFSEKVQTVALFLLLVQCTRFEQLIEEEIVLDVTYEFTMRMISSPLQSPSPLQAVWMLLLFAFAIRSAVARTLFLKTGLLEFLFKEYEAGHLDAEIEVFKLQGKERLINHYFLFLSAYCGELSNLEDSAAGKKLVIQPLVNILKTEAWLTRECMTCLAKCSSEDFAGLDDLQSFFSKVLEILKGEIENPKSQQDDKYLSTCFGVTSALLDHLEVAQKEKISSLYLEVFSKNRAFVHTLMQTLSCLDKGRDLPSFNTLLTRFQFKYQQLVRSSSSYLHVAAFHLAKESAKRRIDCYNLDPNHIPSFSDYDKTFQYYHICLEEVAPCDSAIGDVLQLICEFATETYRVHQLVDVLDKTNLWRAAEVVEIEDYEVKVELTGWPGAFEWIKMPSCKIAPAFTFTRLEIQKRLAYEAIVTQGQVDQLMSSKILGIASEEMAVKLLKRFGNVEFAMNCARWMNRDNLKHLL
eukprot:TRINITY_DN20285_c0_g1_i3.p1 TRINITY_DN20285_c0_g1~~TRINITY_DN20285_c0_g1_i3.p1  ORF type:complete len:530 (-),score=115.19 TRINITY_DN20285_c0_g1_i3:195-1784(-)